MAPLQSVAPQQNQIMMQYFHWYSSGDGNFWNQAIGQAPLLAELGITAVWLPPASKGCEGARSNGYDAYDLYDLGEFNQKGSIRTKFGKKQEYLEAIRAFHNAGIQVYADVVLNHKAGADATEKIKVRKVNPENRTEYISEPFFIEAYTKFNFPGRQQKYSPFTWNHRHFTGVDRAVGSDEQGIFRIESPYGEKWQRVIGEEKGNFDYLMFADIEARNPAVIRELQRWGKWYLQTTRVDGFRLDAVKHMSISFVNQWLDAMRAMNPNLFAVGEYWSPGDLPLLKKYLRATEGRMLLFDAALHQNFYNASTSDDHYDLRTIFNNTLVQQSPKQAVTLVDNHDTQPLQEMESTVSTWFKPIAYALILLRKSGYPCLFYPDLYGARYTGIQKDGVQKDIQMDKCPHIEQLLLARKKFAYGHQLDYFTGANCIGWTRIGSTRRKDSGCAVIISNGRGSTKKMYVGKNHGGKYFRDLLNNSGDRIKISRNGWGRFTVPSRRVSVWITEEDTTSLYCPAT